MAKTPIVPGSPIPIYNWPDGKTRPYPPGRIVRVGNKAGLQNAVANALAGDVITISWPGNYDIDGTLVVTVPNLTITSDVPGANQVVLRGGGMDNVGAAGTKPHGIFSAQPGLTLSNFTIADFYYHGLTFASGAGNPSLLGMRLIDCGQQFIKASVFPSVINNGRVIGSFFGYTQGRPMTNHDGAGYFYGSPIDCHSASNWIVRGNVFSEIAPTEEEIATVTAADPGAFQFWWAPAVYFWNRSANNVIEKNLFINCGRAANLGLVWRNDGTFDHTGGIIRNNMAIVDFGRLGAEQQADSDGMFNVWDCPGGAIVNNTAFLNGQIANLAQARWSQNVIMSNNLGDRSTRLRDGATASSNVNNIATAQTSWFVDPHNGPQLSATGLTAVTANTPRLSQAVDDYFSVARGTLTRVGATV